MKYIAINKILLNKTISHLKLWQCCLNSYQLWFTAVTSGYNRRLNIIQARKQMIKFTRDRIRLFPVPTKRINPCHCFLKCCDRNKPVL